MHSFACNNGDGPRTSFTLGADARGIAASTGYDGWDCRVAFTAICPAARRHRSALQKKAPEAGPGGLQYGSIQAGDGNNGAIHGLNGGRNEAMNTCA
jgi:hypothetical protein